VRKAGNNNNIFMAPITKPIKMNIDELILCFCMTPMIDPPVRKK
jgi:hypothetical protein